MDKGITRLTVIFIAIYFIVSYLFAQLLGMDILRYSYILLLEACVVAYTFCSGKYHCRFVRWTALSILICDTISHADYYFDFIPVECYNLILLAITGTGLATTTALAIRHFYRVRNVKKRRNGIITY